MPVQLVDDFNQEGPEVFKMNLSNPSANATIARASANATIIDNDAQSGTPRVSINDFVVDEADGTANFVITLDRPSTGVVSMNYATQNGTALAGQDYVAAVGNAQFRAGRDRQDGQGRADQRHAPGRRRDVQSRALGPCRRDLARSRRHGGDRRQRRALVSKPSISIDDVVVGEQDGFADFVIRLDAPTSAPITVYYSTAPSTATDDSDFIPDSGTLTFAPGETVKTVPVQVVDDFNQEGTEVFKMNLSNPSANATIARASANATIIDNDAQSGTPLVSISDLVVDEAAGTANFVVTFNRPSASVVSIDYATQNGTALAGQDYVAQSGTLNFAPGETAKTVKVLVVDDTIHEGPETFSLKLSNLVGATTLDPVGTATIDDNDPPPPVDILWQNASGQAAVWDVSGNALIGGGVVSPNPGPSWKEIGTGDFNDDGLPDLLWQNTNGQAAIWDMDGTISIAGGAVTPNPGPSWKAIGTGDFNDDGLSDILWQNANGQAAIWEMNGTTPIGGGVVTPNPGASWKAVGTGDFNGDGLSDILWQNANGQAAVWDMNGATPIGGGTVTPNPGASWKAVGTGDFNDDGHSDILWQNANGQAAIWEMNGNTVIGGGVAGANPGAELESDRDGRLQWRRSFRHPVAEHQWAGRDLGNERDQRDWRRDRQRQSRAELARHRNRRFQATAIRTSCSRIRTARPRSGT